MGRRKGGLLGKFIKLVLSIVIGFLIAAGILIFALSRLGLIDADKVSGSIGSNPVSGAVDMLLGKGIELNIAVFGVDGDETRTDVIFVVHFDSKEKKLALVSVPRDTRVYICDEAAAVMDAADKWYPTYCKINEVHSYAGKENGPKCSVYQLEELLGIDIDHYIKINLEGFRAVVDMIGGVEVDVPQDMYYKDPYQDLYINLKAGLQTLNGDTAEQLVRFRRYPQGDVQRVQVQQLFLKAFFKKLFDPKTMITNVTDYVKAAYEYVDTDISIADALKYVGYVKDIDTNNISMGTIPGAGQYVGDVSYYICDEPETKRVVYDLFYAEPIPEKDRSYGLNIEVANGSNTDGLAAKNKSKLEADGYTVTGVLNYTGEKTENTRIYVRKDGQGKDLKNYYPDCTIETNTDLLGENTDILIILGTNES